MINVCSCKNFNIVQDKSLDKSVANDSTELQRKHVPEENAVEGQNLSELSLLGVKDII